MTRNRARLIMRTIFSLVIILSVSVVWAQETKDNPPQEKKIPPELAESFKVLERWQANAPTTLAEAHAALERLLSPETLAEIDAMSSERDMVKYHFSIGLNMRNGWGLWADSPLAKHMKGLGFTHPDGMSGVILGTFWRKRHGQDLRLQELTAAVKEPKLKNVRAAEEKRVRKDRLAIRNMVVTTVLSIILLAGGLACLFLARISLHQQRIRLFRGSGVMSRGRTNLHRAAFVFMSVGVLLILLLLGEVQLLA